MSITYEPAQEQRDNSAARIGAIFGLKDPGAKIVRSGVRMEAWGDDSTRVLLKVEIAEWISREEAEAILNGVPLDDTKEEA